MGQQLGAPLDISQPNQIKLETEFFFPSGFAYANSSFPTTFLQGMVSQNGHHFPSTDPPTPFPSLHDPALPGCRVDEDLSRELGIQQQALRNVSLMGTKEGVRHQREESWAREDHCAHNYSGGWEHAAPPHMPYPSSVHTQEHTQTHAHPSSSGERRLRLRR